MIYHCTGSAYRFATIAIKIYWLFRVFLTINLRTELGVIVNFQELLEQKIGRKICDATSLELEKKGLNFITCATAFLR